MLYTIEDGDANSRGFIPYIEFENNLKNAKQRCEYITKHYKIDNIELHYIIDGISERQYKI